jgi:competence protein ComFC
MPGNTQHNNQTQSETRVSPGFFAPKRLLQNVWDIGVDLLFPPRCAGCGRVDFVWCERCQDTLDETVFPQQVRPLAPLVDIAATGVHQHMIREAVQGLKYGNARLLAEPLGERLVQQLQNLNWPVDLIVPVPLHATRLAERGYNQAQLLSEQVAQATGLPCVPQAVERQRNTQSQVTLDAAGRQANLEDAFRAIPEYIVSKNVLLIDDVYTTGATLSACAQAVLQAGAQAVYGLTVTVARL